MEQNIAYLNFAGKSIKRKNEEKEEEVFDKDGKESGKEEIKKIYENVEKTGQIKKVDRMINMGSKKRERKRERERDIIEKRKRVIKMEKKG